LKIVAVVAKHVIVNSELYAITAFFLYKYLVIFIVPGNITALS